MKNLIGGVCDANEKDSRRERQRPIEIREGTSAILGWINRTSRFSVRAQTLDTFYGI